MNTFIIEAKSINNEWLRSGNKYLCNNVIDYLKETFVIMGKTKVSLLRADSGFFWGAMPGIL